MSTGSSYSSGWRPWSIHSFYATLSTIIKYAALARHIPVSRIGKGTVNFPGKGLATRVFLTLEDLLALMARQMPYWDPMIKLVAETGLRCGGAAGLPAGNLDLARGSVSSSSASSSTAAATGPSGYRRASAGAGSDSTRTPWRSCGRT